MQTPALIRFEIERPGGRTINMQFPEDANGVWLGRDDTCHVVLRSEVISRSIVSTPSSHSGRLSTLTSV